MRGESEAQAVACSTRRLLRAFVTLCTDFDFIERPVNNAHEVMVREFRLVHKDPFDRMLAVQAVGEGMRLVSKDGG